MEVGDGSESDWFWGFVSVFRRSDFYDPVGQSANKIETQAKQVRLVTMRSEGKTTMKTNPVKQENAEAMGKFSDIVHCWLVPAGGVLFMVVELVKVGSKHV